MFVINDFLNIREYTSISYALLNSVRKIRITNRMQIIISLTLIFTGVAGAAALVLFLAQG
ncbi:hypothetical protein DOW99_19465 [Salmonella enterica subsp. enterica]|nr:hypothetical protein [Salmonella enterica subsp. enterica serovar Montevideo]